MSIIETDKQVNMISPGQKIPTHIEDRLVLREFLLKLVPEELVNIDDGAIRRIYILIHIFLEGEEFIIAKNKILPEMRARGLSLDLSQYETDRDPFFQDLSKMSNEDLLNLHKNSHDPEQEQEVGTTVSPLCELVCLLDALVNLLRRYI